MQLECHIDSRSFTRKILPVPTIIAVNVGPCSYHPITMTFVRRLSHAAILIFFFCLASLAAGERHSSNAGPPSRFGGPRLAARPLPPGGRRGVGVPILGCLRTDPCHGESSPISRTFQGNAFGSSVLLSLRGGGGATAAAARTATAAKPKSVLAARTAPPRTSSNPRKDKGGDADGRKKASMSASVFNLVNNVAGAFQSVRNTCAV